MISVERIIEFLSDDDREPFQRKEVDHDLLAINLLRERIPYEKCKSIIQGAGRDQIYLCDIAEAAPYLTEEDLAVLSECNIGIEDESYFYLFV